MNKLLCIIAAIVALTTAAHASEYFVATNGHDANSGTAEQPFATLKRARDAIRELKQTGPLMEPVTVRLQGGTYPLSQDVQFGPDDSGTAPCPITYAAAEGAAVVLDGGRRITSWKKHDDRLWVADLPEVASGAWRFRQLYVNGQQRFRARTPNEGYLRVAGCPEGTPKTAHYHKDCETFQFKPGDIRADWTNLSDVEVIVYHFWTDSHLPIKTVDTVSNLVTFAHKAGKTFTDDFSEDGARYIVENVFEGLDAPGEWYLNRRTGQLFYYPMPGEDVAEAEVVAPFASAHLRLEGKPVERRYVEHLRFRNLSFAYSNFEFGPGDSNDRQGSANVPAAVTLRSARSCAFEQCRLFNLGTFGFEVMAGCSDNEFTGNELAQLAAGGIRVGGGKETSPPWERTRNNRITDNWLHHYGQDFPSAVGMLLTDTEGNTVAHNHIHHGGYTGVSIGWVWGYTRSVSQNNRVEFNHIHHIGGVLSDMGGIYTLGVSPGTVIRNNHIHDVDANHYGGWGIYHDEGSTHLLVENNVVHHTKFAPFNIHFAKEITVRNNIFALGKLEQASRGRAEPHKSVFFENNIVYWREGELLSKNWKDVPYTFHAHPKDESGTQTLTDTFEFDWNLYFNPTKTRDEVTWAGGTWAEWQKRGKDRHSHYADPLFVNPEQGDFTLRSESPALALGFQPIDLSQVGPRVKTGPNP
ncbi:MAG: right-handed parallel beta-helix repeat-containing protein [Pirellulaceae bacterium]